MRDPYDNIHGHEPWHSSIVLQGRCAAVTRAIQMKTQNFQILLFLLGWGLLVPAALPARTFTVLHAFDYTNGAYPTAPVVLSSNTIYGTTSGGGLGGGIIFRLNIDGTGFQTLHNFAQTPPLFNDNDIPIAGGLILSGTKLYGTTSGNSIGDNGTVFAINIDGSGFTNLYAFSPTSASGTNYDGAHPYAALLLSGNKLYGTAAFGGSSGRGTIFAINVDGSSFTTLYSFAGGQDGAEPKGGLVIRSNVLYGTTCLGGNGTGTIFGIETNGTFKTLYAFSPEPTTSPYTNQDGFNPWGTLTISGDTLYGTTQGGGGNGHGTVFKVGIDGKDFTLLHGFSWGEQPFCGVVCANGILYGTGTYGGTADNGTIYSVNEDGTSFNSLYSFPSSIDIHGWYPSSPLFRTTNDYGALSFGGAVISSSNVLYGVTTSGGPPGYGVVYSLSLEPLSPATLSASLGTALFGPAIFLTYPTNVLGFPPLHLEISADPLFTTYWWEGSPSYVTNGPTVTEALSFSSPAKFFRLTQHW